MTAYAQTAPAGDARRPARVSLVPYVEGRVSWDTVDSDKDGSAQRRYRFAYAYAVSCRRWNVELGATVLPCGWCGQPMRTDRADVDHAHARHAHPTYRANAHLVHVHCNRGRKAGRTDQRAQTVTAAVAAAAGDLALPVNRVAVQWWDALRK